MASIFEHDIVRFHRRFGIHYSGAARLLPGSFELRETLPYLSSLLGNMVENARLRTTADDLAAFRIGFMLEELHEYVVAVQEGDVPGAFDALVDLGYVMFGTAHLHGFPYSKGWDRVHAANMRKIPVYPGNVSDKRRSRFDIVKPPDWKPPVLDDLLGDVEGYVIKCPACGSKDEYPLEGPFDCTSCRVELRRRDR
jgi:hypothetical protein